MIPSPDFSDSYPIIPSQSVRSGPLLAASYFNASILKINSYNSAFNFSQTYLFEIKYS